METQISLVDVLSPYQQLVEKILRQNLDLLGPKTALRDACEYALLNGGKRFRPALVLMIARALGFYVDVSQAALAIECFHTASLIADDLPCMDDAAERRQKPTVHRVYGESTALLATYVLISTGYGCLAKNAQSIRHTAHPFAAQGDHLCFLAVENVSYNTGLGGASGGQYLDLASNDFSPLMIREVMHKKTVSLFEISFVLGWLFGGGEVAKLPQLKKSAAHFGMAFQIADDLDDMAQDLAQPCSLNIANLLGKEKTLEVFYEEIEEFNKSLRELRLDSRDFCALAEALIVQVQQVEGVSAKC